MRCSTFLCSLKGVATTKPPQEPSVIFVVCYSCADKVMKRGFPIRWMKK